MKGIEQYIKESSNVWEKCVEYIRKHKYIDKEIYNDWDKFSIDEQLEILQEACFEGFILQDDIDNECILYLIRPTTKQDILGYVDDELYNLVNGYNVEDSNHYVIKYKGKDPIYTEDGIDGKTKVPRTNLEWICCNQGEVAESCWFINDNAKKDMIKYMGLIEFKKKELNRIEYGYQEWT